MEDLRKCFQEGLLFLLAGYMIEDKEIVHVSKDFDIFLTLKVHQCARVTTGQVLVAYKGAIHDPIVMSSFGAKEAPSRSIIVGSI